MRYRDYILILIFIYSCNFKNQSYDRFQNYGDPSKVKDIKIDFKNEIIIANKRFKVSNQEAIDLLLKVKEIRAKKDTHYNGTLTSNDLILVGVPNDSDQRWLFDIGQFQKGSDKYYGLAHFWVDANNGEIEVLDLNFGVDDPIDLNEWIKLEGNRKE